jgi:hypothetical protein
LGKLTQHKLQLPLTLDSFLLTAAFVQPIQPSALPYFLKGHLTFIRGLAIVNVAVALLRGPIFRAILTSHHMQHREENRHIKAAGPSPDPHLSHRMRLLTTAKISLLTLGTVLTIGISMGINSFLIKETENWKRMSTVKRSSLQSQEDWQDLVLWDGQIDPLLSPSHELYCCYEEGFSTSEYWTGVTKESAILDSPAIPSLLDNGRTSSPILHAQSMLSTECVDIVDPSPWMASPCMISPWMISPLVFQTCVLPAERPTTDPSFIKQCRAYEPRNIDEGFHCFPHTRHRKTRSEFLRKLRSECLRKMRSECLRKARSKSRLSNPSNDYKMNLRECGDCSSRSEMLTCQSPKNSDQDQKIDWNATNLRVSLANRSRTAQPSSEHHQHPEEGCAHSNHNTSLSSATPPYEWQRSRKGCDLLHCLDSENMLEGFRDHDPHQEWPDPRPHLGQLNSIKIHPAYLPTTHHHSIGSECHGYVRKVHVPGEGLYDAEMEVLRQLRQTKNRNLCHFTRSLKEDSLYRPGSSLYRPGSSPYPSAGNSTSQDLWDTYMSVSHVWYCCKCTRDRLSSSPPNGAHQEILSMQEHDPAFTKLCPELGIQFALNWCLALSGIAISCFLARFCGQRLLPLMLPADPGHNWPPVKQFLNLVAGIGLAIFLGLNAKRSNGQQTNSMDFPVHGALPNITIQMPIYRDSLYRDILSLMQPTLMSLRKANTELDVHDHSSTYHDDDTMMLCRSAESRIPSLCIFTNAAIRYSGDYGNLDLMIECHVPSDGNLNSSDQRHDSLWTQRSTSDRQTPAGPQEDQCTACIDTGRQFGAGTCDDALLPDGCRILL